MEDNVKKEFGDWHVFFGRPRSLYFGCLFLNACFDVPCNVCVIAVNLVLKMAVLTLRLYQYDVLCMIPAALFITVL